MPVLTKILPLMLISASAWAQGQPPPPPPTQEPADDVYPRAFIDRPLTLPKGLMQIEAGISNYSAADFTLLGFQGDYGITDQLSFGVSTALFLSPSAEWIDAFTLRALYSVHEGDRSRTALGLQAPVSFDDFGGYRTYVFEAPTRWQLSDRAFVQSGHGLISLTRDPYISQWNLNLLAGYQPSQALTVMLDLGIVSVNSDGDTASLGDLGFTLRALYAATNKIDLSVGVQSAGDSSILLLSVAARI